MAAGAAIYSQRYGICLPTPKVILSRRRRISVPGTFELIGNKYQPEGRSRLPRHSKPQAKNFVENRKCQQE